MYLCESVCVCVCVGGGCMGGGGGGGVHVCVNVCMYTKLSSVRWENKTNVCYMMVGQ